MVFRTAVCSVDTEGDLSPPPSHNRRPFSLLCILLQPWDRARGGRRAEPAGSCGLYGLGCTAVPCSVIGDRTPGDQPELLIPITGTVRLYRSQTPPGLEEEGGHHTSSNTTFCLGSFILHWIYVQDHPDRIRGSL